MINDYIYNTNSICYLYSVKDNQSFNKFTMSKELEIIIEVNRIKHLCRMYQDTKDEKIWEALLSSVMYLCSIV